MAAVPPPASTTTVEPRTDEERTSLSVSERYQRLLRLQTALAQMAREIGPAFDLQTVLHTALDTTRSVLDVGAGTIWLVEGDHVRVAAASDAEAPLVRALRIPIGTGLAGRVVASGEPLYSPDVRVDPRMLPEALPAAAEADVVSYYAVPLVCLGEVIGILQIDAPTVDAFDDETGMILEGIAAQVAGAIESARRYQAIAQLETMKSDFIARVSHELRTPITIMAGFVSTLMAHHDRIGDDDRRHMLERIDTAVARLSGLIDELLLLSKIEAGVVTADVEPVDLADVLTQVRKESAEPAGVTVRCEPGIRVDTDRSLLVRALGLLVDNGLKYAGGVELRGTREVIEVVDEGPGIPSEVRSVAFERFARDNVNTTVAGMGVGLPIARTLVAALGGNLELVDTDGDAGTHWRLRLP